MTDSELNENLPPWDDICKKRDWSALLLGNGFSRNVWERFSYESLYDTACDSVKPGLTAEDTRLFDRLKTRNFESVLSALSIGRNVTSALGGDPMFLQKRYESIRLALIAAVHHVHVPWQLLQESTLAKLSEHLARFKTVYSSNYDLLSYWAVMNQQYKFKDYFFSGGVKFDISNTQVREEDKCTTVHFLHGGLHLYREPNGQTLKRTASGKGNLLDLFGEPFDEPYEHAVPLFISEGTADEKRASIAHSDYLWFVFSRFAQDDSPIVVFGHSLSEHDEHLIKVLGAKKERALAISIRQGCDICQRKHALSAALNIRDLMFFDAATHPLGAADLEVNDPAS